MSFCFPLINFKLGQQINITVIDFGIWARQSDTDLDESMHCDKYANLREHSTAQETSVCGGEQRIRNVYVSRTSTLDISMVPPTGSGSDKRHFLLKYEGNLLK